MKSGRKVASSESHVTLVIKAVGLIILMAEVLFTRCSQFSSHVLNQGILIKFPSFSCIFPSLSIKVAGTGPL
jgi:hypothetical protein